MLHPSKNPTAITHDCIHSHSMLQQLLCLTHSSCTPLHPSQLEDQKQKVRRSQRILCRPHRHLGTFAACHRARQCELLTSPTGIFLNSHCNQPFFTRMMWSFILLPKLLKAWRSLHTHLPRLVHI